MSYQDVWIKGEAARRGQRECAARWEAIARVLGEYRRWFTMLDLGASEGYFSFRAAEQFDCVAVMVEGGSQLGALCERNAAPRTVLLRHRISVEELEAMADAEHFDVVLALNVLHHFAEPVRAARAVLRLADTAIIETPPPEDINACGQGALRPICDELARHRSTLIASAPSHVTDTMRRTLRFDTPKTKLHRPYVDSPPSVQGGPAVLSDRDTKRVRFPDKEERDWIHGINLRTYQRFGGAYPDPQKVAAMVRALPLPAERHGDIRPWNLIFDGDELHLIDGGDARAVYDDERSRAFTAEQIEGMVA